MSVIISSVATENAQQDVTIVSVVFMDTNTNTESYNYSTDGITFTPYSGEVTSLSNNSYSISISGLYPSKEYSFVLQAVNNGSTGENSNVYPFNTDPNYITITSVLLSGGNFSIALYFNINDTNTNNYTFLYSYDEGNTYDSPSNNNNGIILITSGNMQPETDLLFIIKIIHNDTQIQTISNTFNYHLPLQLLNINFINTNSTTITANLNNNSNNPTFNDSYQYNYSLDGGNIFTSFALNNEELIIPNLNTDSSYSLVLNVVYNDISKNIYIDPFQLLPVPTFDISSVTSNGSTIIFNNYTNGFIVDFSNIHLEIVNVNNAYTISGLNSNTYYNFMTSYKKNSILIRSDEYIPILIFQTSDPTYIIFTTLSPIICFKEDTKILTPFGYTPIQDLRPGDLVKTLRHDFVPINMIGRREIHHPCNKTDRIKNQLYRCSKYKYPELTEDLVITGCHCILENDFVDAQQKVKAIEINGGDFETDKKCRLPACVDSRTTVYEKEGKYMIYHLALDNDDYYMNYGIYANGLLVETCSKRNLTKLANMELMV